MPLKTVLTEDQLGELDESTRGLYAQMEDGSYVIDIEGVDDHPSVKALKSGHSNSKKERDEAKRKAQGYEKRFGKLLEVADDLDLSDADEERLTTLLPFLKGEAELPELDENGRPKSGGGQNVDLDKIKANARKPVERERDEAVAERDTLKAQFQGLVTDNALTGAIAEIKVAGPYTKAVKAMFRDKVKVAEGEDGQPVALIEGEYGEQPVDKYLKDWAQTDEGKAFIEADRNGGGGARPGAGGGKIKNPWSPENWSPKEQARVYREDPEKAKRMAAEHGKKVM